MSDYFQVAAVLDWMLSEIEAEEATIEAEKVNEVQHFDWSNIKTILVEEKPLETNSVVKAKEIYVEREEVHVEGAATSIKAEETTVEAEKVKEVQHFDWNNIKTILVEEKPLKVEALVEAKVIPLKCEVKPAEGADTSVKAEKPVLAAGDFNPTHVQSKSTQTDTTPKESKLIQAATITKESKSTQTLSKLLLRKRRAPNCSPDNIPQEMPQKKMLQEETTTPKSSSFVGMWRKMKKFFRGKK